MKRGGPLKRKTPLKSNSTLGGNSGLKRTPLKQRSAQRSKVMKEDRVPLITALIEAGFSCEISPVLEHYGCDDSKHCRGKIEGLHELRKRSAGGSLVNRQNLIPACNWCNSWVEDNPLLAHEWGLVVREGDPEWERLGKRNDP